MKVIRVFIGSPGGLEEERRSVQTVVSEINTAHSDHWGCQFKLVGWEDTIPGFQRPQDKINEDLDKCDYFIGVLWNRWGTRTSNSETGYTSGFHEEFCRAREHIESGRMKDLALYFKKVDSPSGWEPGAEIKKVLDFRQECVNEKKVFFKDFISLEEFKNFIRGKLTEIGWRECELVRNFDKKLKLPERAPQVSDDTGDLDNQISYLIQEQARDFLTEIARKPDEFEKTRNFEIARFRLIASSLYRFGNDDLYVGNHDANLIFQHLRDDSLSELEVQSLIDCGVVGFYGQNVPLWHWIALAESSGKSLLRVKFLSIFGNIQEKKNAINILELTSSPIPSISESLNRETTLRSWINKDSESQLTDAVASFLADSAEVSDIPIMEELASECESHIKSKIDIAIVSILAKSDINSALKRVVESEVDRIPMDQVNALFQKPQLITSQICSSCLSAKSENIRLRAAQILFDRNEISLDQAEELLTDTNHQIRFIAVESLCRLGRTLTDDIVKKALTVEKKTLGILFSGQSDSDVSLYQRYQLNRLTELSYSELSELVSNAGFLVDNELFALYTKYKSRMQNEIRENLKDGFKTFFDLGVSRNIKDDELSDKLRASINGIEEFYRSKVSSVSLSILCSLRKRSDLELVRQTLDNFKVEATEEVLSYLSKFGEWADVGRILQVGEHPASDVDPVSIKPLRFASLKAEAVFRVSKDRIADILSLEMNDSFKARVLALFPSTVFADLTDEVLLKELTKPDDDYRVFFALKCILSFPKPRIESLLRKYISGEEYRFYNTIHWLDLGASMPAKFARTTAKKKLASLNMN